MRRIAFECAVNMEKRMDQRESENLNKLFGRIKCVSPDQEKELWN